MTDTSSDDDTQNTHGTPDSDQAADTTSGGAPEGAGAVDDKGVPVDNPSGG